MKTASKTLSDHQQPTVAHALAHPSAGASLVDHSPAATAQRQLAKSIQQSPRMMQQKSLASEIANSPRMIAQRKQLQAMFGPTVQTKGPEDEEPLQGKFDSVQKKEPEEEELLQGKFLPLQMKMPEEDELHQGKFTSSPAQLEQESAPTPNKTGLPDDLKSGIESLSGISMDHVKVHYNSSQPAQLNALAYAQGTDIHVAPGQEQHLPHEAWHVVQQAQGRVKPTMQMKDGVPVNDDQGLEHEADVMGGKAVQMNARPDPVAQRKEAQKISISTVGEPFQLIMDGKAFKKQIEESGLEQEKAETEVLEKIYEYLDSYASKKDYKELKSIANELLKNPATLLKFGASMLILQKEMGDEFKVIRSRLGSYCGKEKKDDVNATMDPMAKLKEYLAIVTDYIKSENFIKAQEAIYGNESPLTESGVFKGLNKISIVSGKSLQDTIDAWHYHSKENMYYPEEKKVRAAGANLSETEWKTLKETYADTLFKKAKDCLMMGLEEHVHRYQDISGRYMSAKTGVFQHSMGLGYKDKTDDFESPDFDEVDIVAWFDEQGIDVSGLLWKDKYKPRTDYIDWLNQIG